MWTHETFSEGPKSFSECQCGRAFRLHVFVYMIELEIEHLSVLTESISSACSD